ncbi:peptidase U32 family protein [Vibrio agarivorans]|uniref:peptidase U32 family protein n=1 Tax=Vibrio agarivorans TaxID=153622 RepID=UPI0025B526E0|nr:peptidase U32 family protein [Vibrio agarivorans]MDN3659906.1 peptidase U32 family protein [Vibrio agarivorans]
MYNKEQFELLAPGGDLESIKAAIAAGADAIYCGLDRFNARNRAANITLDVLDSVLELAHQHDCKIFLTLNIIVLESEIPAIVRLLQQLLDTRIDGVIVQDLGLAYILKHHFPALDMHVSTQMNTHNEGQIALLGKLGASRVNLSRELNIEEITQLAAFGHQHNVLMEVFVHGSYCIGFSGLCYISSARNGASGNRGRCSQPCREQYQQTEMGKDYPLNMKDNSAFSDLEALAKAGVYSLKVEGRIKKSHYVHTVVDSWRKQIDRLCDNVTLSDDTEALYTVFNRDFTNGYLQGDIHRDMYIDNPRDFAPTHFSQKANAKTPLEIKSIKQALYDKKTEIIESVEEATSQMHIEAKSKRSLKGAIEVDGFSMPSKCDDQFSSQPPRLSVLLSDKQQLSLINQFTDVEFMYQLPDALAEFVDETIECLQSNSSLIPLFPAVLIGAHFEAARQILETIQPRKIVTNNLGVAELAKTLKLEWIAGPQLNLSNSFAFKCIDEELHGTGAYVSSELNEKQIKRLYRPEGFELHYTIYQPLTLLTSRQCLFIQSVGCKKQRMNRGCMKRCSKHASILNLKDNPYIIDKKAGSFNSLYSDKNVLNLEVLGDLKETFTHFTIDIRTIKTQTEVTVSDEELITLFSKLISGQSDPDTVREVVINTTNQQYKKGVA